MLIVQIASWIVVLAFVVVLLWLFNEWLWHNNEAACLRQDQAAALEEQRRRYSQDPERVAARKAAWDAAKAADEEAVRKMRENTKEFFRQRGVILADDGN